MTMDDAYAQLQQRAKRTHGVSFDRPVREAGSNSKGYRSLSKNPRFEPRWGHEGESLPATTKRLSAKSRTVCSAN
jgi:hypothetical protein